MTQAAPKGTAKLQSVISLRRFRTAGATITTTIRTVAITNARLSGRVKNTRGFPREISIARRMFSSIIAAAGSIEHAGVRLSVFIDRFKREVGSSLGRDLHCKCGNGNPVR